MSSTMYSCWNLKYIGCLEINTSMKSLDFDTRSQLAKECINRVCESAGLKTLDKKRRQDKKVVGMLAPKPIMEMAGSNVRLIITSSYLSLTNMETGQLFVKHDMPNISFTSGGDAETLDFVAYVAKGCRFGRACFVLECGGGQAQDVVTMIGQAFELRFKEFLKKTPRNISNDRTEQSSFEGAMGISPRGTLTNTKKVAEEDYYNDLPGKVPPDITNLENSSSKEPIMSRVSIQTKDTSISSNKHFDQSSNLIDLNTDIQLPSTSIPISVNGSNKEESLEEKTHQYVNCSSNIEDMSNLSVSSTEGASGTSPSLKDPFDMKPFNSALESTELLHSASTNDSVKPDPKSLRNASLQLQREDWFHGPISRRESENLVANDGDFLVRESQVSEGQYVLTGMQGTSRKHLLLVDPEGVVRTKDKVFESVSHLINYHRDNGLPIISTESALLLRNPVKVNR